MSDTTGAAGPSVTYGQLRAGSACARGLQAYARRLRAAGVVIPRLAPDVSVHVLDILDHLGVEAALEAYTYARLDEPWLRLLAADCAERALLHERVAGREPDPRSWAAVETARRYARGEATRTELVAAEDAALAAARTVARTVARAAAEAAAGGASENAERRWQAARMRLYLAGADVPPVTLED